MSAVTVYSVQHWEDGDGIHSGWVTGYGYFTHSRADAEAQLAHDRKTYPRETFRLAMSTLTDWYEL